MNWSPLFDYHRKAAFCTALCRQQPRDDARHARLADTVSAPVMRMERIANYPAGFLGVVNPQRPP